MELFEKIYDRSSCEIEDILNHPNLDKQDVELLGEFVDIIKDIEMIYDYQGGANMDGYSGNYMRGRSTRMMPYNRSSYARGRSMDNGYSRGDNRDVLLDHLTEVMDMAKDEKDKKAISRLMQQMSEQ